MKTIIMAKTFTPIYDQTEDRLRLIINYNELHNRIDFMITRRFILNLLPTAEEFINKNYGNIQEKVYKRQRVQKAVEKSSQKTDLADLELFHTHNQLLLEVNFAFNQQTNLAQITFKSKDATSATSLDSLSLLNLIKAIKSSVPFITWGISLNF